MKKLWVGLTAGRKYDNYVRWLSLVPDLEVIKLGHEEGNLASIRKCSALVLSGGEDVHPRFYNKPEYVATYGLDDIDEYRDEFELEAIGYSDQHHFPILGICRGLQIVNVFMGGTLIPDIPSFENPDHSKYGEGNDRYHSIEVMKGSLLASLTGVTKGEVNSAHHQSAALLGKGLEVNAISDQRIVEGIERSDKSGPFFMLVQWHPERMENKHSAFSRNLRESFVEACRQS